MTQQTDIPGMNQGMFFEYYVFEPRTNYTEEDLYYIVQFIDVTMNDDEEVPHPEHFDGRVFTPKKGITVAQFADILTAMKIMLPPSVIERLPKRLQTHFDTGLFIPYDDFGLEDLSEFMMKFLHLRLTTEQFNTLPKKMKRQFIVFTRDGKTWRFGDRPGA